MAEAPTVLRDGVRRLLSLGACGVAHSATEAFAIDALHVVRRSPVLQPHRVAQREAGGFQTDPDLGEGLILLKR